MSDQLFDTVETEPKKKRTPPNNPIIGQARAAAWDGHFETLKTTTAETNEVVAAVLPALKKYIAIATAVIVVVQIVATAAF